jgi:hypothetical protein
MVGELPSGLMVGLVETKKRAVSVTDTEPYSFPSVMEDAVAEGKRSLGGAPEVSGRGMILDREACVCPEESERCA